MIAVIMLSMSESKIYAAIYVVSCSFSPPIFHFHLQIFDLKLYFPQYFIEFARLLGIGLFCFNLLLLLLIVVVIFICRHQIWVFHDKPPTQMGTNCSRISVRGRGEADFPGGSGRVWCKRCPVRVRGRLAEALRREASFN